MHTCFPIPRGLYSACVKQEGQHNDLHSVFDSDGWLLTVKQTYFAGENLFYRTLQSVKLQVTVATQQLMMCYHEISEI